VPLLLLLLLLPLVQMFNSIFWPCMGRTTQADAHCVDKSVDDVAFVSGIITNMQQLLKGLPLKQRAALSGYSNGGMLAQAMLCQRPSIADSLSGVALLGTMLGSDFAASSCGRRLPRRLPLLWVHGVKDPVLPYGPGGSSMGVKALGAGACFGAGVLLAGTRKGVVVTLCTC
jgi:poly(3-hydroxybutyrate) depolymerase